MREQEQYEHGVPEYKEQPYSEPLLPENDRDEEDAPPSLTREQQSDLIWVQEAKQMYAESTDYMRNSLSKQWEDSWRMFRNEHPSGSKYHMPSYRS